MITFWVLKDVIPPDVKQQYKIVLHHNWIAFYWITHSFTSKIHLMNRETYRKRNEIHEICKFYKELIELCVARRFGISGIQVRCYRDVHLVSINTKIRNTENVNRWSRECLSDEKTYCITFSKTENVNRALQSEILLSFSCLLSLFMVYVRVNIIVSVLRVKRKVFIHN